jgi:hypothetical protein
VSPLFVVLLNPFRITFGHAKLVSLLACNHFFLLQLVPLCGRTTRLFLQLIPLRRLPVSFSLLFSLTLIEPSLDAPPPPSPEVPVELPTIQEATDEAGKKKKNK